MKKSFIYLSITALLLSACQTQTPAPVESVELQPINTSSNPYHTDPYAIPAQNDAPYSPVEEDYPVAPARTMTQGSGTTHTVVKGDTLYNISKRYQVEIDDIRAWNNLPDNNISLGQTLYMNSSEAQAAPLAARQGSMTAHTVVKGDTLYNISKRYQVEIDDIRAWNNLPDNNISLGQTLQIAQAGALTQSAEQPVQKPIPAPTPVKTPIYQEVKNSHQSAEQPVQKPIPVPTPVVTPTPVKTPTYQEVKNSLKNEATLQPPTSSLRQKSVGAMRTVDGKVWSAPTYADNYQANSTGVDYLGSEGQPIYAAADGIVAFAASATDEAAYMGNMIAISHNQQALSVYGNNQKMLVKKGEKVQRGQQIATMGKNKDGRVQLHFEIRQNGLAQDPFQFLPK